MREEISKTSIAFVKFYSAPYRAWRDYLVASLQSNNSHLHPFHTSRTRLAYLDSVVSSYVISYVKTLRLMFTGYKLVLADLRNVY